MLFGHLNPRHEHHGLIAGFISSLFWGFKDVHGFDQCSGGCSLDVSTPVMKVMLSSLASVSSWFLEVKAFHGFEGCSGACSPDIPTPCTKLIFSSPALISSLFWGFKAFHGCEGCPELALWTPQPQGRGSCYQRALTSLLPWGLKLFTVSADAHLQCSNLHQPQAWVRTRLWISPRGLIPFKHSIGWRVQGPRTGPTGVWFQGPYTQAHPSRSSLRLETHKKRTPSRACALEHL